MSNPVSDNDIEDVLTSIRRLLSDDGPKKADQAATAPEPTAEAAELVETPEPVAEAAPEPEPEAPAEPKLVLTSLHKVSLEPEPEPDPEPEPTPEPDAELDAEAAAEDIPEDVPDREATEAADDDYVEIADSIEEETTRGPLRDDENMTLEERIAELEAAVGAQLGEFEPDGSEMKPSGYSFDEGEDAPDAEDHDDPEAQASEDQPLDLNPGFIPIARDSAPEAIAPEEASEDTDEARFSETPEEAIAEEPLDEGPEAAAVETEGENQPSPAWANADTEPRSQDDEPPQPDAFELHASSADEAGEAFEDAGEDLPEDAAIEDPLEAAAEAFTEAEPEDVEVEAEAAELVESEELQEHSETVEVPEPANTDEEITASYRDEAHEPAHADIEDEPDLDAPRSGELLETVTLPGEGATHDMTDVVDAEVLEDIPSEEQDSRQEAELVDLAEHKATLGLSDAALREAAAADPEAPQMDEETADAQETDVVSADDAAEEETEAPEEELAQADEAPEPVDDAEPEVEDVAETTDAWSDPEPDEAAEPSDASTEAETERDDAEEPEAAEAEAAEDTDELATDELDSAPDDAEDDAEHTDDAGFSALATEDVERVAERTEAIWSGLGAGAAVADAGDDPNEADLVADAEEVEEIPAAASLGDEEVADDLLDEEVPIIDEHALRDLVSEIVRSELQGELGERITRNVRKLVRREIYRALASKDLEQP